MTPEMRTRSRLSAKNAVNAAGISGDDFPKAFHFELVGPNQLRFSPVRAHKPERPVTDGVLTSIEGRLTFDPATYEITRLEYDLTHDVSEPFLK